MYHSNLIVLSENAFFHLAIKEIQKSLIVKSLECDGHIAIIDAGSLSSPETLTLPVPLCKVVVIYPGKGKENLLSRIGQHFPVSFVSAKASQDMLLAHINNILLQTHRRLGCGSCISERYVEHFTPKQKRIFELYMSGFNSVTVARKMNITLKTAQTYYSAVTRKAFERLDVEVFNGVKFYLSWGEMMSRYFSEYESKKKCINCPVKNRHLPSASQ